MGRKEVEKTRRKIPSTERAYTTLKAQMIDAKAKKNQTTDDIMQICAIATLLEDMEFDRRMECGLGE